MKFYNETKCLITLPIIYLTCSWFILLNVIDFVSSFITYLFNFNK
jgi:hypothetical protein